MMASSTASITAASAQLCNSSSSTFRRGGSRSSLVVGKKYNNNKTRKSKNVYALRNFDYPEALLFDCDGVLCETERDGHRVTFNKTFKENGLDHEWGVELYGELLKIGGGKERMTHYFDNVAPKDSEPWKSTTDPEERKKLVAAFHKRKTEMFLEVVKAGELPLRPGVARLIGEALEAGSKVAVCSTSNEVGRGKVSWIPCYRNTQTECQFLPEISFQRRSQRLMYIYSPPKHSVSILHDA